MLNNQIKRNLIPAFFTLLVLLCAYFAPTTAYATDAINMYRLYNQSSGEHLYTLSTNEYETLGRIGWIKEGRAWVAPSASNTPVYRLYNPNSGDHHYTISTNERDTLSRIGWQFEGIGWYSSDGAETPVYRLFNPNETVGTHHYTISQNEYATLGRIGWIQEGVAWYALDTVDAPEPTLPSTPQEEIVYWTPRGTKWHSTIDCPALGRSHTILSGTVQQAQAAGKDAPCKDCH